MINIKHGSKHSDYHYKMPNDSPKMYNHYFRGPLWRFPFKIINYAFTYQSLLLGNNRKIISQIQRDILQYQYIKDFKHPSYKIASYLSIISKFVPLIYFYRSKTLHYKIKRKIIGRNKSNDPFTHPQWFQSCVFFTEY